MANAGDRGRASDRHCLYRAETVLSAGAEGFWLRTRVSL
jgi:hypothetical protein